MGLQQDCSGNVALVFLAEFLLAPPSDQNGFDEEVDGKRSGDIRVYICNDVFYIFIVWMRRTGDCLADW